MNEDLALQTTSLDLAEYDVRKRWQQRPPTEFPSPFANQWGFDQYGLWQSFSVGEESFRMRYIPPGSFLMGSPEDEADRSENELQHFVTLTQGFWLGETTITQTLWQKVMGENSSRFQQPSSMDSLPIDSVSWNDCQIFFERLETYTQGLKFTFPTEVQWEYACRAGTQTTFSTGANLTTDDASYDGNYPYGNNKKGEYRERTMPTKYFRPNAWGLYQMHGNLWEWCLDGMREYTKQAEVDPVGEHDSALSLLRGGSWDSLARSCRSADRSALRRVARDGRIGLRAAMVPPIGERDARIK